MPIRKSDSNKNLSNRQLKVAALIQQSLSKILQHGKRLDSRLLENPLTITNVKVTADLKKANCYFLPFGANKISNDDLAKLLNDSRYIIRHQLTEDINIKFSPELKFFYDYGFENLNIIETILQKISS